MTLPRILALRDSLRQQLASLKQGSTAHKVIRGKLYGVDECLAMIGEVEGSGLVQLVRMAFLEGFHAAYCSDFSQESEGQEWDRSNAKATLRPDQVAWLAKRRGMPDPLPTPPKDEPMTETIHEYTPEPAFWSQGPTGGWIPRYVRGVGSTPELAKLHAELVRADMRFKIACKHGLNGAMRLEKPDRARGP